VVNGDEGGAARMPLILVNPAAGGGRASRVARLLGRTPGRLVVANSRERMRELAGDASAGGHDRVVVIGGDGSVQDVVNGLLGGGGPLPLGIVPAGSGNDLARSLGLPRDPRAALEMALGGRLATVDAGLARGATGERWFVSAAGVGFDAQVAAALATRPPVARLGSVGYLLTTLAELGRYRNARLALRLDTPDGELEIEQTCLFAAVANGPYYGGGMRICPAARMGDGLLDVCLVGDISRLGALREIPGIYRGVHVRNPAVSFFTVSALQIEGAALSHLDGEPFGGLPVRFAVVPAALRIASARVGT
jgi:diacylglycerol kinase (ATP)